MTGAKRFTGIIPALLTPFSADNELMLDPIPPLVDRLVGQGIGGLFVCGSTGEWYSMHAPERMQVVEIVMEAVAGRVPVMVHVGANDTRGAIALARHAEQHGADAISALPPAGRPLPSNAVWDHFRALGAACGLPLYLYHLPQIYGDIITLDAFLGAMDTIPTLAGVKFSSYYIRDLIALKLRSAGRLNIISGCAEQLLSATANGAEGSICTWYNVVPRLAIKILDCVRNSDIPGASKHQDILVRYAVSVSQNHLACVKFLVGKRGIDVGYPRQPAPRMTDEEFEALYPDVLATGIEEWFI